MEREREEARADWGHVSNRGAAKTTKERAWLGTYFSSWSVSFCSSALAIIAAPPMPIKFLLRLINLIKRGRHGVAPDRKSRRTGPGPDSLQPQERLVKREGLSNGRRTLVANAAGC